MDIALLNTKITIQKNTLTVDEIGNHVNSWVDFYTCHATISNEAPNENSEAAAAGTTVDNSRRDFTVRWCEKISGITSDQYRIVFGEEIYDIVGVDHQNFKRKSVKLKCRKERR